MKLKIEADDYMDFLKNATQLIDYELMWEIANEIVNYSKDAFRNQKWDGVPWEKLKARTGKALIDTGTLWNSIKPEEITDNTVVVVSREPYAAIMNDGGTIRVTDKMRSLFWSKYKQTGDSIWKNLARTNRITIPARTFLAVSSELNENIKNLIIEKWERL